jgi:hypothetical protein
MLLANHSTREALASAANFAIWVVMVVTVSLLGPTGFPVTRESFRVVPSAIARGRA